MALRRKKRKPPRDHYRLVDGQPVLEPDLAVWDQWQAENQQRLILSASEYRGMQIVTFFHGIDDLPNLKPGPPKLFRTTITGGKGNGMFRGYATAAAARAGHAQMLAMAHKYFSESAEKR